jgi:hypothetical protein
MTRDPPSKILCQYVFLDSQAAGGRVARLNDRPTVFHASAREFTVRGQPLLPGGLRSVEHAGVGIARPLRELVQELAFPRKR